MRTLTRHLQLDTFYQDTWAAYHDHELLHEAGWLDHPPVQQDERWLGTPLGHIQRSLRELADPQQHSLAVLLSTGSFAPIHDGHIEMMQLARQQLQQAGQTVLGGYISPSHDAYVGGKAAGTDQYPLEARIWQCQQALRTHDWLAVDSWEGRATDIAVNFTTVIDHLQQYLVQHTHHDIDIWYVFGADNATFARAFVGQGQAVCIARKGYQAQEIQQEEPVQQAMQQQRIHFVHSFGRHAHLASSCIRTTQQPPKAADGGHDTYVIRDDISWGMPHAPQQAQRMFRHQLADIVGQAIGQTPRIVSRDHQQQLVDNISQPFLHLDVCTDAPHQLHCSRLFDVADSQIAAQGFVSRPGYPSLSSQLQQIPPGTYTLVDDDIASGTTMQRIRQLLPDHIHPDGQTSLLQRADIHMWDVVDGRDFLLGSRQGGLVITLPDGTVTRCPYLLPYVQLVTRASIPPPVVAQVNAQLWQLNADFHRMLPQPMLLGDSDTHASALWYYLGWQPTDTWLDVIAHHQQSLSTGNIGRLPLHTFTCQQPTFTGLPFAAAAAVPTQ